MPIPDEQAGPKEAEEDHEFTQNQHKVFEIANQALRDSLDGKPTVQEYLEYRNQIAPLSPDEINIEAKIK